ncbi:AAA family ATPase [Labilibaculum antarcticum]|uniref:Protein CR006 P-loop domain-containing protein n=1 Tax=Labilibaculum antarcticum TaxID=1717717 RepID=A0A1Y1CTE2_9BACT|nr:AAA family ATPase [Labilibaculum antarcticum]BAX82531.1 hypothetical protein ALGA_4240 [Labilibaculum antarcticum]
MASTTTNKKEIVDFLWEWAETHNDWGKLLISEIVTTENNLSITERESVLNYFLQSISLHSGLPAIAITKPTYTPTNKKIELESLTNVTGVNRLAKNQTLKFSDNLTVIFGENGTGKTGYGRILKNLGFSYDDNNTILSNIFGTSKSKTATIKYKANNLPDTFDWDGTNKNNDLESISVFNNNCVQISLSDRQLIVSPIGFHLFSIVISELNELTTLLRNKITQYPTTINFAGNLSTGSPQQIYISSLSSKSTEQKLIELSTITSEQEQALKVYEEELSNLNKKLLEAVIQNLNASITEIGSLVIKIENAKKVITKENCQAIVNFNKQILVLENKAQTGIKEIAETNGIEFYETTQFSLFIKAAENYIKILSKPEYPNSENVCVYCNQSLDDTAKTLLSSYRTLLNDKTQENLSQLKLQKNNLIAKVTQIDTNIKFHQATIGLDTNQKPIQPPELLEYNRVLEGLKTKFATDDIKETTEFNFEYQTYIDFLNNKKDDLKRILTTKKTLSSDLATKEKDLKSKIAELKDRKQLSQKVTEIKIAISNMKIVSKLNSKLGSFSTNSISRKTTEARDLLIKSNFDKIFKEELKAFRKAHINIDLSFGTDRGKSKVSPKINTHNLTDILSEGEQKAIALAEFLTELQLDNIIAPVIFDDPVNSLDHHIIDDVARRLIKLSKDRQVVIFTHSVLLFNSFLFFSKQQTFKALKYKFYNTKNEYDETGFVSEAEEEINKVKSYISKINLIINNTPKDRPEADVAEDGYGYLRSAIELLIEYEIFQGTVKRYQKNVALTQFVKIDGELINTHKDNLNEIFERSCGYIKGHSNPTAIFNPPTLRELKSDFGDFEIIRKAFLN